MPDNPSNKKTPVALEQLLHLKRAERPESSFWDEFDRELQRRQLATVLNNRPWYTRLPQMGMIALRKSAPFGAAAGALVAGFIVFDQQSNDTTVLSAQVAQATPENLLVVLPTEQFNARPQPAETKTASHVPAQREYSQAQFVVHQFELPPAPVQPWKTVASPNLLMVSSTDMGEGFESAAWTAGPALRAPENPGGGSF